MESLATTPDGLVLAANGIDPVLRWDGFSPQMDEAGLAAPATAITVTGDSLGTISGTYYVYSRFLDALGNPSDLSPIAGPVIFDEILNVNYTNVPIPTTTKVKTRQILRNTAGQTNVFYVDVETNDLSTASFTSTRTDAILQVQEAVVLLDVNGNPLADVNGVPPSDKSVVVAHLDRMFMAGEEVYADGSVKTTFGSKTVYGIGTKWPATFVGRFLWVNGADKSYEIDAVDVVNQTITLLETYASANSPYASYGIRPAIAQRRLVQFSRAGLPESWLATDAISIQEDGDEIVGLMPQGSFIYIVEKRHLYRFTFQEDPLDDGFVFLSCDRGCINDRCHVVVDETSYLLDEAGIYRFSGSREVEQISAPIQDLFEPRRTRAEHRIHFEASRYFHASYDYGMQVIRWFVALSGTRYPRHALCFNTNSRAWWIEEYPFPIAASCSAIIDGERRVALGGPGGQVYVLGNDSLDLVDNVRGTVRGEASSRTPLSLTDEAATFGDDIVGAPIVVVTGGGKYQMRRIVERVSETTVRIDRPWNITPESGDTYQIGGIKWRYRLGWFRWAIGEEENTRQLEIMFEPCISEQHLDAYLYQDRSGTPLTWDATYNPEDLNQMGSTRGETNLVGDLTGDLGWMQRRLDGHKEYNIDGPRLISWEFRGITNTEEALIYQVNVEGATGGGG